MASSDCSSSSRNLNLNHSQLSEGVLINTPIFCTQMTRWRPQRYKPEWEDEHNREQILHLSTNWLMSHCSKHFYYSCSIWHQSNSLSQLKVKNLVWKTKKQVPLPEITDKAASSWEGLYFPRISTGFAACLRLLAHFLCFFPPSKPRQAALLIIAQRSN